MRNRITAQVAKVGTEYEPSRMCAWCKHRDGCESFRDAEVTALALVRQERNDLATPADVLTLHEHVKMVESAAKAARAWIREYIEDNGSIPAGNGKELARTPIVKKTIDAQLGWPIMAEVLDDKELAGVVTVRKGALEKAVSRPRPEGEGVVRDEGPPRLCRRNDRSCPDLPGPHSESED
jgi:transposase-like protein